jgi:hypothetical protein
MIIEGGIHGISKILYEIDSVYLSKYYDYKFPNYSDLDFDDFSFYLRAVNYYITNKDCSLEDFFNHCLSDRLLNGWICGNDFNFKRGVSPFVLTYKELDSKMLLRYELLLSVIKSFY